MPSIDRMYWFRHNGKFVYVVAGSVEFAKEKFQARWGYWPDDPFSIDSKDNKNETD